MPFEGGQLKPAEIAAHLHALGFRDFDLIEMTATILGESKGFLRAYNDNEAPQGEKIKRGDKILIDGYGDKVFAVEWASWERRLFRVAGHSGAMDVKHSRKILSRDVGLAQINISVRDIGTEREAKLYDPLTNLRAARRLFDTRETLTRRRRFNPWYAFTTGWATFPEWWVFRSAKAAAAQNKPREWVATGRYLHEAITGVANYYAESYGIRPTPLLQLSDPPSQPKQRPVGDGPRPVGNRGRGRLGG